MNFLTRLGRALGKCPPGWKLTRAVSNGLDADVGWHLSACDRCAAEYRTLRRTASAVGQLAAPQMTPEGKQALAARILATPVAAVEPFAPFAPRSGRRAMWFTGIAVVALVATVASLWAARRTAIPGPARIAAVPAPRPSRAAIRAIGAARFTRLQPPPDEIVRVDDGTVDLEVQPLSGGERFRVVTADAEVEVRGTAFEVSAARQELIKVHVWRGRVEVRSRRGAFATLNGGDEWVGGSPSSPPAPPTFAERAPPGNAMVPDAARALPPPARPIRARVGLATERAHAHGRSFADAWQLLRQGDARRAAAAFGEVARAAGSDAIAEDASYWRGVALARAGDAAAARAALAEFIARYPGSPRFGEASVILGWSLLQAGDAAAARAAFQRASHDPSDRVRASAVAGLSRLGPTPRAAREQRGVANDVRGR